MAGPFRIGESDALLIVDIQYDFCPGGALAVPRGDEVIPVINRVARRFSRVLLTQDWHPDGHSSFASSHVRRRPFDTIELPYGRQVLWPDHCVQGTRGAELHAGLDVPHAQMILRKGCDPAIDSYSAFFENDRSTPTGLVGYLRERGLTRVFLAGLALDFCVHFSAIDAQRSGLTAVVIEDACRAIDLDGSLAETRAILAEAGIALAASDEIVLRPPPAP